MGKMGNVLWGFFFAVSLAAADGGAPTVLPANAHPWGGYLPKSWCIVQTTTIANVGGQAVQTVQTVRTELQAVDADSVTLQESETLNVNGRSVSKNPQLIKYDFFQEPLQANVKIRQGEPVKLQMSDKKTIIPCAVRIYEQQTPSGQLTTTIWYSAQVYPYVLRAEKVLRSSPAGEDAGGEVIRQSVMLVQETSALKSLRGLRKNRTYTTQTIEKAGNITKITDANCSWDVPGGLLTATTREFDAQNREISRSVSTMTNYFLHEFVSRQPQRVRTVLPAEMRY